MPTAATSYRPYCTAPQYLLRFGAAEATMLLQDEERTLEEPWLRAIVHEQSDVLAEPALASGAHGKPYFPDAPQLQFSISHSGAYWLCAFSAAPVGLDVQQHRDCQKQALARRFFSPAEQAFLERTSHAPFFDLWCAKESYLKFTGEGLSGLEAVCTVSPEGGFPSVPGVNLQLLPLFAGYSACLCTASPAEIRVQFL